MKEVTFDDLDQNNIVESEQYLVNLVRTRYPHLDIRSGTALRDLLVSPDAAVHALFSKQAEEQRNVASLQALIDTSEAGGSVDTDDVSRVMSNFNIKGSDGTSASGVVRVVVSASRTYSIQKGFKFETLDGLQFVADSAVVANEQPVDDEVKLYKGSANYYFLVPVTCSVTGSAGNIPSGTALSITSILSGFVAASSFGDFSGGADTENLSSIKARIPVALSHRGLFTATSVEAVLRDRFDDSGYPILAVSVVGYGNPAQLRDKHNAFGVGVGGRADIYVRNFTTPYVKTIQADFTYDSERGLYVADVAVPGMYNVAAVSDPETEAIASYSYSVKYTSPESLPEMHDFDASDGGTELAGTVWRTGTVLVEPGGAETGETKTLSVGMICLPLCSDIQEYIDNPDVRNVGVDYVVRCPAVCRVSVNAVCRYDYGMPFDIDEAKNAVANYVNTTGFVGRLTRSEIACVLRAVGAKSVDITDSYMLTGYVVDAKGETHRLSGDALDIDDIAVATSMLTKDTCVFSTTVGSINITAIPS